MEDKVIQFGPEEYIRLGKIAKSFVEKGTSNNPPKFVIITGGVASGKTTTRKQSFTDGYVNLDFWDIYLTVEKEFGKDDPKLTGYAGLVGDMVLFESIEAKKNIVIEIIGADDKFFTPVMNKMKDIGYELNVTFVACDPVQAYQRHLKAIETDKDYQSAHYTEKPTLSYFYAYFKLDDTPISTVTE